MNQMTRKNPYENQEETLDIPDFLEEKNVFTTTDSSIDKSIFKMSDEELYDDTGDIGSQEDDDRPARSSRKRSNVPLIISIITICILLAACIGAAIFALNQHKAYVKVNTEYQQLLSNQNTYKDQLAQKDAIIADLNKQLEEYSKNKPSSDSLVYVVTDGPLSFRKAPVHEEPDFISYQGAESLEDGERFTALEIVTGTDDPEYTYAKIADGVYICLGTPDEPWAKKAD